MHRNAASDSTDLLKSLRLLFAEAGDLDLTAGSERLSSRGKHFHDARTKVHIARMRRLAMLRLIDQRIQRRAVRSNRVSI